MKHKSRRAVPGTGKRANPCHGACLESRKCVLTKQRNIEKKKNHTGKLLNRKIRKGKVGEVANGGAYRKIAYLWNFPA